MIRSMTAFASDRGELGRYAWAWELRSVNAKGLDLRLRVPDWLEGLETVLRGDLAKALTRGNVTLTLRVTQSEEAGTLKLNTATLEAMLSGLTAIEARAMDLGVTLAPSCAADLLGLRGVMETTSGDEDIAPVLDRLRKDIGPILAGFVAMRESEGRALAAVMNEQLDRIETLTAQAKSMAVARQDAMASTLQSNLARVLDNSEGADPARVAQELAMIAVKSDITEEIDRLAAHVAAARDLLAKGGSVGRKLDFLMQEFNREANTLCSKSQFTDLTAVGLDLKAVIDQMREQVQNVE